MNPPCSTCNAACCRKNTGWGYAVALTESDLENPVLKKAAKKQRDGSMGIPYRNGNNDACHFLDPVTNKCKVYDQRPEMCRFFNCTECPSTSDFLKRNPNVEAALSYARRQREIS